MNIRYDLISERIIQVFTGDVSWTIYRDGGLNSPVRSIKYAVVENMYEDGTVESFVAPLVISRDGLMTWSNYFSDTFVGVLHQEDRPTAAEVAKFTKEMDKLEQEIEEMLNGSVQEIKEEETSGLIKFEPKKRPKPVVPDGNK